MSPNISLAATTAELQAQIAALLAQIQQLQAQMFQQQPQQWCYDFKYNLNATSRGKEIGQLQTALEKEGFEINFYEKTNQIFDESTADAVIGFQQKYKDEILSPYNLKYGTGFVGKSTRAKLNSLYGCGVIQPIPTPVPVPVPAPIPAPTPFNQPPTISGVSGPTTLNINQTGNWEIKASDPEQGNLSYQVFWGDEAVGASAQLSRPLAYYNQTATFTHSYSKSGIYYPTFTVTDNQSLSAKTSISVKVGETSITQPVLSISPTNITVGNTYTFSGSVINAAPNTDVKLYLQRPNGTMKYENYYVGRTDSNGVLKVTITQNVSNAYCCAYSAWVEIAGQKSNPVNINITPVVSSFTPVVSSFTPTVTDIKQQISAILAQLVTMSPGSLEYKTLQAQLAALQAQLTATQPSIIVLSPNGGEVWQVGLAQTIKWAGGSGTTDIYLYRDIPNASCGFCNYAIVITSGISTTQGQYVWTIPNFLTPGSTFYIRLSGGSTADNSDASFSIVSATASVSSMTCVDINNATYTGSISTGGGIWPGYNWGYGYGIYREGSLGWLDYNKQNTANYPLEIHYTGNTNYAITYSAGELKFTCNGVAKTVWLPSVFYPVGGSATVVYGSNISALYVASDGSTYYDKALTQLARSAGTASINAQQQMASVLQSAEKILVEMFNYLAR